MSAYLLDTDVCIDHLRGTSQLALDGPASYSVITRCELFAGRADDEEGVRAWLDELSEIDLDRSIAERAGRLRRDTGVATPDCLIAATALEHGLTLCSRNERDFSRIPDLSWIDPAAVPRDDDPGE